MKHKIIARASLAALALATLALTGCDWGSGGVRRDEGWGWHEPRERFPDRDWDRGRDRDHDRDWHGHDRDHDRDHGDRDRGHGGGWDRGHDRDRDHDRGRERHASLAERTPTLRVLAALDETTAGKMFDGGK